MKTTRRQLFIATALICALAGTAAHAQSAANGKAAPAAADQSAYASAVETYIRFLPSCIAATR